MVKQEGWWLGKVCPYRGDGRLMCIASKCAAWQLNRSEAPFEGVIKIKYGDCRYGRQ